MPLPIRTPNSTPEQQIKELTVLFKEQQMNQENQSSSRPASADDKSKQNMTRLCPYGRRNGHTFMYCRTNAHDAEIKRQQTRNNQERRLVFTHDYKKKKKYFGFQKTQNFNQEIRYGNRNKKTPYRQTGINPDRNRNPNSGFTDADQITLGTADPTNVSKLSINSKLDQRIPIPNTSNFFTEQQSTYTQLS